MRSTTMGYWRMLTLGAEYVDTWAVSPESSGLPGQQVEKEQGPLEETDTTGADGTEEASCGASTLHKYDTVLHLDEVEGPERRDGVRHITMKHETLNSTARFWPGGWDTIQKKQKKNSLFKLLRKHLHFIRNNKKVKYTDIPEMNIEMNIEG